MELKDTLTLFFSLGAIVFSFLTYRRGNRIENENHLYKTKVDAYTKILAELQKLLAILDNNIDDAKEYLKNPDQENVDLLNENADDVDSAVKVIEPSCTEDGSINIFVFVLQLIKATHNIGTKQ